MKFGVKSRVPDLTHGDNRIIIISAVSTLYRRVMGRGTDRQTDGHTASNYSVFRKKPFVLLHRHLNFSKINQVNWKFQITRLSKWRF